MIQLNIEFLTQIQQNAQRARDDFANAVKYIKNSTAVFSAGQLQTNIIPKIFDGEAYSKLEHGMLIFDAILEKSIEQYLSDPQFRQLFGFDKELERLIMLDSGYGRKLPIARADIFFDELTFDFKFCEINTDGSSAMNEDREIGKAFENSFVWKSCFGDKNVKRFELFDSWVLEFGKLYTEWLGNRGLSSPARPRLAIVDFLDIGTKSEFEVFRQAFARHGYDAIIVDITLIQFDGSRMYDEQGMPIDAIYRRAVTSECMQKLVSIQPFLQGITAGAVCLVGHFRTQVVHDKNFFRILRHPYTRKILTSEQNMFVDRHVPITVRLHTDEFDYDDVVANKDRWLIKPQDRYGSNGVIAGKDCTADGFGELIRRYVDTDYILQEYCSPFKTTNIYFDTNGIPHTKPYGNMTGIFLYNGRVAGLYTRQMIGNVTTQQDVGRVVTSIVVLEQGESTAYKPSQYQPQYRPIPQSQPVDNIVLGSHLSQPEQVVSQLERSSNNPVVTPMQQDFGSISQSEQQAFVQPILQVQDVATPLVHLSTNSSIELQDKQDVQLVDFHSTDIQDTTQDLIQYNVQSDDYVDFVEQTQGYKSDLSQEQLSSEYASLVIGQEEDLQLAETQEDLQQQRIQTSESQTQGQDCGQEEQDLQLVDIKDSVQEQEQESSNQPLQVGAKIDFDFDIGSNQELVDDQSEGLSAEEQAALLLKQLESSLFDIDIQDDK